MFKNSKHGVCVFLGWSKGDKSIALVLYKDFVGTLAGTAFTENYHAAWHRMVKK